MRILLVDDDAGFRCETAKLLGEALGHAVAEASGYNTALDEFDPDRFDLVITDMNMEKPKSGLYLLMDIRDLGWMTPVIVMSEDLTDVLRAELKKYGAREILNKPFSLDALKSAVSPA